MEPKSARPLCESCMVPGPQVVSEVRGLLGTLLGLPKDCRDSSKTQSPQARSGRRGEGGFLGVFSS